MEEEEGPPRGRTIGAGGRSSGRLGSAKARVRALDDGENTILNSHVLGSPHIDTAAAAAAAAAAVVVVVVVSLEQSRP